MSKTHKAAAAAFHGEVANVPAEALAAMVEVTVTRDPAATVVIIGGVVLPQAIDTLQLPRGRHRLEAAISGRGGDVGTAAVKQGDNTLATAIARIPAGLTESFSPPETFNV